MKLSEANREILLINLHNLIVEYANLTANHIQGKRINQLINYPPNGGMTEAEESEIAKLSENKTLKNALRKILASHSADVIFSLLNVIDGTADPKLDSAGWGGVMLIDFSEDMEETEMLHDEFYSTYWDWKEKKRMDWKLDLLPRDDE